MAIAEANNLEDMNVLQVGQELTIRPASHVGVPEDELRAVVIALQDIGVSSTITADMLAIVYYPVDIVPAGSLSDPASAVGMTVGVPIGRYQPVLTNNLTELSLLPDFSAIIPDGTVAVSVPITNISSVTSEVQEGEIVSLVLPMQRIEGTQVVFIGTVGATDMVVFAMSAADATTLTSMLNTSPLLSIEIERQNTSDTPVIFEYGGHVTDTNTNAAPLMLQAGMTWMKIQLDYTPGMDTAPIALSINHAHAYGFNILLTIVGNPEDMSADSYVEQYAAFLGEVAALNPDAIEVWNEPNLDRTWPTGQISGTAYADMLRQAYQAIKDANSDVMVISAAPAPTGAEAPYPNQVMNDDRWIRELVDAGGLDYMDCLGAHYVEGTVSPSQISGDERDDYYTRYLGTVLLTYTNLSNNIRPICFTELGYLSDDGYPALDSYFAWAENTTIDQQAVWLTQAALFAQASEQVRLMIIWNVDFTTYNTNDPTAGYAIIRADGSCPACTALAAQQSTFQTPIGSGEPITVQNERLEDGRISVQLPEDGATLIWGFTSQVDIVSSMYFIDTVAGVSSNPTPRLVTQRIIEDVELVFNDDRSINLVLMPDDATIMQWILEARVPFMVLPSDSGSSDSGPVEALPVGYYQANEQDFSGFVIPIPASASQLAVPDIRDGQSVDIDVMLEFDGSEGHYQITNARYWGTTDNHVLIVVPDSSDAGVLSWVEQGGFTVTLSEAQP